MEDNKAFDIKEEIESHQRMVAGRERKYVVGCVGVGGVGRGEDTH